MPTDCPKFTEDNGSVFVSNTTSRLAYQRMVCLARQTLTYSSFLSTFKKAKIIYSKSKVKLARPRINVKENPIVFMLSVVI